MMKKRILNIALIILAISNINNVYSQKGKQKEKPAQGVTVMKLGQETVY
jgi:hypothetical protein